LQRRAVSLHAKLSVSRAAFQQFSTDIANVSEAAIHTVLERISRGECASTHTDEEKTVLKLMREVSLVTSQVPGTAAVRTAMQNEIQGMTMDHGLPSFYITINPANVFNPIV
ncbi:hypothetical protein JB92DRAFT_2656007, partial [Gautieria morchelliformis]